MNAKNICQSSFQHFIGRDVKKTENYHLMTASSESDLRLYHLTLSPNYELNLSDLIREQGITFTCISYSVFSGHAYLYLDGDETELHPSSLLLVTEDADHRIFNHGMSNLVLVFSIC